MLSRRKLLRASLACTAAAIAPRLFAGELSVAPLRTGFTLLSGTGGNVLAVTTSDGVVLVDSGAADDREALLAWLGDARVHTLFNTHWHPDQIGGNEAVGAAGATITAHEKTRLRLATGYYLPAEDRYEPPAPADAQPTRSFYTRDESTIGGRRIEIGYLLEAHTDGDCYVFFRDANVLAVGDAVASGRDPELDWFGGGWLGGRVDALDSLLELADADTLFVPSHGPTVGRAAVQAERDMLGKLFDVFVDLVRKGDSVDDILAAGVMNDTGRRWQDPRKFVQAVHKGLWAHHNTLSPDIV